MTRSQRRDVERRLIDTPAGEPPEGLLVRLRADVPERLALAAEPPRRRTAAFPPRWLAAAAVVVLTLGGGWLLWRLSDAVLAPKAAVEEARGAVERDGERDEAEAGADTPTANLGGSDAAASGVAVEERGEAPRAPAARGEESLAAETTSAESMAADTMADTTAAGAAAAPDRTEAGTAAHAEAADRTAGPPAPSAARPATPPTGTLPPPAAAPPAAPRQESDLAHLADDLATERTQALAGERAAGDEETVAGGEARRFSEEVAVEEAAKADQPRRSPRPAGAARSSPAPPATDAPTALADLSDPDEPRRQPSVHDFVAAGDDRFSTFGLHVDTRSWRRVQASVRRGALPPATVVRVEEVVNALDAGGPAPGGGETFGVEAEGAPSPFTAGPRDRLLRFALRARQGGGHAGSEETVAEEARVQVEFDARVVATWRLLGFEEGDLEDDRFRHDDTVDAGEIGAGHTVTALYEVRLVDRPAPDRPLARLTLRYRLPESGRSAETERLLRVGDLSPSWEAASPVLRLAAVAAELAEQLRGAESAAGGGFTDVARHAAALAAERPRDRRAAELAETAARAAELARR